MNNMHLFVSSLITKHSCYTLFLLNVITFTLMRQTFRKYIKMKDCTTITGTRKKYERKFQIKINFLRPEEQYMYHIKSFLKYF